MVTRSLLKSGRYDADQLQELENTGGLAAPLAGIVHLAAEHSRDTHREWRMLARLGEIAQNIPDEKREHAATAGRKPRVDFLVGGAHSASLKYELNQAGVPFASNRTTLQDTLQHYNARLNYMLVNPLKSIVGQSTRQQIRRRMKNG